MLNNFGCSKINSVVVFFFESGFAHDLAKSMVATHLNLSSKAVVTIELQWLTIVSTSDLYKAVTLGLSLNTMDTTIHDNSTSYIVFPSVVLLIRDIIEFMSGASRASFLQKSLENLHD